MGSEQVAAVLRQSGSHVRLVVARPVEPTSPEYQALDSHAPIVPTKILADPEELDRHLVQNGYPEVTYNPSTPLIDSYENPFIYAGHDTEIDTQVIILSTYNNNFIIFIIIIYIIFVIYKYIVIIYN